MFLEPIISAPARAMHLDRFSPSMRWYMLGGFLFGFGMNFWSLFFNLLLQEMGHDKAAIGATLAYPMLASALFSLPAAALINRFQARRMLLWSTAGGCLFLLASLWTEHLWLLRALAFLGFGAFVVLKVINSVFISENSTPAERDFVFAASFSLSAAGSIAAFLGAGHIKEAIQYAGIDPVLGYRLTISLGLLITLSGCLPYRHVSSDPSPRQSLHTFSFASLRQTDRLFFAKALLPVALVGIGAGLVVQFMNLYFRDRFDMSDGAMGSCMAAMTAAMVLGFSISPILSRHWGRVPTIVVTQLASLPFMLVLGYTGSVSIAISAFICRGVLMNMGGPIATALIMDLCPPSQRAWLNAFQNITVSLAWALSAVIFGSLLKGDYRVTFAVSAGLYLLSSVLYFAFFFERKHATVASESAS